MRRARGGRTGRKKLRVQSGEVRWAFTCFSLVDFHSCWSSSPGGKFDPTEESTLHSALREAKQGVGIDADKVEIGRLGPPTQSLNGFRVWPYVAGSGVAFDHFVKWPR